MLPDPGQRDHEHKEASQKGGGGIEGMLLSIEGGSELELPGKKSVADGNDA